MARIRKSLNKSLNGVHMMDNCAVIKNPVLKELFLFKENAQKYFRGKYGLQNGIILSFQFYLKITFIYQNVNSRISNRLVFKRDSFKIFYLTFLYFFKFSVMIMYYF